MTCFYANFLILSINSDNIYLEPYEVNAILIAVIFKQLGYQRIQQKHRNQKITNKV